MARYGVMSGGIVEVSVANSVPLDSFKVDVDHTDVRNAH
jgi:hypothetical protein